MSLNNKNIVYFTRNGKVFWFNKELSIKICTNDFIKQNNPGKGKIYKEKGYQIVTENKNNNNIREYKTAFWLIKNFGGNITLINNNLNRANGVSKPDYEWKGKWWDLKCVNGGLNKISARLNDAIGQINKNPKHEPGGAIIDITGNDKVNRKDAIAYIKRRLAENSMSEMYVILKKGNKCLAVIKSEKKK